MKLFALSAVFALALVNIASAVEHPVSISGRVYLDTNCNGVIDANDTLLDGVSIQMQKNGGPVVGIAQTGEFGIQGLYAFPSDLAPTAPNTGTDYTLTVIVPTGYTAKNSFPGPFAARLNNNTTAMTFNLPTATTGTVSSYDFLLKQTGCFYTQTQCEWNSMGGHCYGSGNQGFLGQTFNFVFGSAGVTIGGNNTLTFTTAKAVQDFLPQSGTSHALTASFVNSKNNFGSLAGDVLALQLSVSLSDAGVTTAFLGQQTIQSGPFDGMTIREVLELGNEVLGGDSSNLPAGVSINKLSKAINTINDTYDNCGCDDNDSHSCHGRGGCGSHYRGHHCRGDNHGCNDDDNDSYCGW